MNLNLCELRYEDKDRSVKKPKFTDIMNELKIEVEVL